MKKKAAQKLHQQLAQLGCPYADIIAGAKTLNEVPEEAWKKTLLWLCAKIDPNQCKAQEDLPAFLTSFGVSSPVSSFINRVNGNADLSANFELLVQGAKAASSKKGLNKRFDESCSFMGYVIQNREKLFPATLKRLRSDGADGDVIPLQTFNPNKRHQSLIKLNSELANKIQKIEKENNLDNNVCCSDGNDIKELSFDKISDSFVDKQENDVEVTFDVQDYKSIIDKIDCACTLYNTLKEIK